LESQLGDQNTYEAATSFNEMRNQAKLFPTYQGFREDVKTGIDRRNELRTKLGDKMRQKQQNFIQNEIEHVDEKIAIIRNFDVKIKDRIKLGIGAPIHIAQGRKDTTDYFEVPPHHLIELNMQIEIFETFNQDGKCYVHKDVYQALGKCPQSSSVLVAHTQDKSWPSQQKIASHQVHNLKAENIEKLEKKKSELNDKLKRKSTEVSSPDNMSKILADAERAVAAAYEEKRKHTEDKKM